MPRRVAAIDAPWGVCASDRNELAAGIEAIPAALGRLETALADTGRRRAGRELGRARHGATALMTSARPRPRRRARRPGPTS